MSHLNESSSNSENHIQVNDLQGQHTRREKDQLEAIDDSIWF
jgi:hypothetical protein